MRDIEVKVSIPRASCDNFGECHDTQVIAEDNNAIRVYCKSCGAQDRIGKDMNGNPENRAIGEWYKRDFVQPDHPLYYKYAGAKGMRVI